MKVWASIAALAFIFSLAIIYFFRPEAGAIIWHVRHGFSTRFNGLQFQVPPIYSVETHPKQNVLYMSAVPGRARTFFKKGPNFKVAMLSIAQITGSEIPDIPATSDDPSSSHDYKLVEERTLGFGPNQGKCQSFAGPPIWTGEGDIEIECRFQNGFEAHFAGTQAGVSDFYSILDSAKRQEGKL